VICLSIKDRGKIKWQGAFFMPQHTKMLKNLKDDYYKQIKPQLDEHELEEIGIVVMESLHYNFPIQITIWIDGYFEEFIGTISKVDMLEKRIKFEVDNKELYLDMGMITSVKKV
jgi:hypothetical protein